MEALGRQLVAQSLASRSDMPLSLLLALEGLERNDSEEAWENLAQLLQYTPQTVARHRLDELGVPMGRGRHVGFGDLAVSPDGSSLAALVGRCDAECCHGHDALWIWDTATWQATHGPIPAGTQGQHGVGSPAGLLAGRRARRVPVSRRDWRCSALPTAR